MHIDKLDDIVNKCNNALVIMLEYQKNKAYLQKVTVRISLKKFLCLKVLKGLCRGHVINDLNGEKIIGKFNKKKIKKKTNQKMFRVEKVIRRKGDQLYVKWKGHNNSFNSWIYKKDIV